MKALILSAGLGTRFRPVTNKLPKPAVPFLGLPIALYAVEYCLQLGATEFYFNSHHLPEALKESLSPYLKKAGLDFHFVHEKEILGSGGAIKNIEDQLKSETSFLVCNADELILPGKIESLKNFIKPFDPDKHIASLLCTTHPEVGNRFGGVWVDSKNRIENFGKEAPKHADRGLHFMGLSVYSTKILNYLPSNTESNILYDGILSSLKEGHKACAFELDCLWEELGNQTEFLEAHNVAFQNWERPCTEILKSCINRFASENLKGQLLKLKSKQPQIIQQHLKDSRDGGWSINLSGSEIPNIDSFRECIFLQAPESEESENYQQIFL